MAPQAGRSALDAVQLFNLSLEFMREHLGPGILLHYVISDGGQRPNIVPEKAATFLYVRAPIADTVRTVMKRIMKAAQGAALMTETSFSTEIKHGKCDYRPNDAIQDLLREAMDALPLPVPTAEETAFARSLQATVEKGDRKATLEPIGAPVELLKAPIHLTLGDFWKGKEDRRIPRYRRCILYRSDGTNERGHLASRRRRAYMAILRGIRIFLGNESHALGWLMHGARGIYARYRSCVAQRGKSRVQSEGASLPVDDGPLIRVWVSCPAACREAC